MRRAAILATSISLLLAAAAPAFAQLDAAGTRLSVAGGAPRFYMTYGHPDERELFAPITTELKRLKLMFLVEEDRCTVLHDGVKLAVWPVARSREEIPGSSNEPFILILGSTTYVPVKQLSRLAPIELKRDRQANLITLVAGARKIAVTLANDQTETSTRNGESQGDAAAPTINSTAMPHSVRWTRIASGGHCRRTRTNQTAMIVSHASTMEIGPAWVNREYAAATSGNTTRYNPRVEEPWWDASSR